MCSEFDLDKMTLSKLLNDWPVDNEFEEFEGLMDQFEQLELRRQKSKQGDTDGKKQTEGRE